MLKNYLLPKGTRVQIRCHSWSGFGELFTTVVDEDLDEDIMLRCKDEPNIYKFKEILRKKYDLKRYYCSFGFRFNDGKLLEEVLVEK